MDRDAAVASAGAIASAVGVPVSADLENGFGDDPEDAAETIRRALAAGLSGGSIEDYSMRPDDPIYPIEQAAERVAAAAEVAHEGPVHFVLTARAENHIRGRDDLADTDPRGSRPTRRRVPTCSTRPGLMDLADIASLVQAVDRPVNVIVRAGGPTVAELAERGVARISVGGSLAWVAAGCRGRRRRGAP